MKKSKCPYRHVFHERGRLIPVQVWDFDGDGDRVEVTKQAKAVIEVCVKCGRKRELKFREGVG